MADGESIGGCLPNVPTIKTSRSSDVLGTGGLALPGTTSLRTSRSKMPKKPPPGAKLFSGPRLSSSGCTPRLSSSGPSARGPGGVAPSFHDLLQQLGEEHDRTLLALRQENATLRASSEFSEFAGDGRSSIMEVKQSALMSAQNSHIGSMAPERAPEICMPGTVSTNPDAQAERSKPAPPAYCPQAAAELCNPPPPLLSPDNLSPRWSGISGSSHFSRNSNDSHVEANSRHSQVSAGCRSSCSSLVKDHSFVSFATSHEVPPIPQAGFTDSRKKPGAPGPRKRALSFHENVMTGITQSEGEDHFTDGVPQEKKSWKRTSDCNARELLPSTFKPLAGWQEGAVKVRYFSVARNSRFAAELSAEWDLPKSSSRYFGTHRFGLWHPHSQSRLYWDLCGLLLLGYDLIMIPFKSAFDPEDNLMRRHTLIVMWFSIFFWSADMVLSFFTGYQEKHGLIVMNLGKTAKRYLRSWFALDIFLVSFDWLLVTIWAEDDTGNNSATKLGRSLRTIRFLRSLRLLRLLKLKRIFQEIQDNIDSEVMNTYWGILKSCLMIITANHLIACVWYTIGVASDDGSVNSLNWVRHNDLFDRDIQYRYATAMHWSLTQFTPASMEVFPSNFAERSYTIVTLLFAMITFSSFISTLTSNVIHLRNRTANETRQFWLLRRYLKDLCISKKTSLRVQRYLEFAWTRQQARVQEKDVMLLALLSQPLSEEIKHESFRPYLETHPLFQSIGELSKTFSSSLIAVSLATKDLCFKCGQKSDAMLIVADGEFEYFLNDDDDEFGRGNRSCNSSGFDVVTDIDDLFAVNYNGNLTSGQWVCEAALWTEWVHLGDLRAVADSQMISIDSTTFGQEVRKDSSLWWVLHKYGQHFVEELNRIARARLSDMPNKFFTPMTILRKCGTQRTSGRSEGENSNFGFKAANLWWALRAMGK